MNSIKVLEKAILTYGKDHQLNIAIEEMSELTKEICKRKRNAHNRKKIIEEIADVYIMLEQMKMIFRITQQQVDDQIDYKVERLNGMLEDEQIPKSSRMD